MSGIFSLSTEDCHRRLYEGKERADQAESGQRREVAGPLSLDEKARSALQQYLTELVERGLIEPVPSDCGVAGGRLTAKCRGDIKPFVHVDFSGLP
jgi:hypothetical protein